MHNRVDELVSLDECSSVEETMCKLMDTIIQVYKVHNPDMEKNQWVVHNLECLLEGLLDLNPNMIPFVEGFTYFLRTV